MISENEDGERTRLPFNVHMRNAKRLLKRGYSPIGLMGDRLSLAIATVVACAEHDPLLHYYGMRFDGELGGEEWLCPYNDASDVSHRLRLLPDGTWLTRWEGAGKATHQARFRPLTETGGPLVVAVHAGVLQVGTGYSHDGHRPPMASRMVLSAGSRFEIVNPGSWFSMCPVTDVTMTVIGLTPGFDPCVTTARSLTDNTLKAITTLVVDNIKVP